MFIHDISKVPETVKIFVVIDICSDNTVRTVGSSDRCDSNIQITTAKC